MPASASPISRSSIAAASPKTCANSWASTSLGGDICQDVCPWNRPRSPHASWGNSSHALIHGQWKRAQLKCQLPWHRLTKKSLFFLPRLEWLAALDEVQFREVFRGSPIRRTKRRGLLRNACIALGNSAPARGSAHHARICALLTRLSASPEPLIVESAQWALSRIQ